MTVFILALPFAYDTRAPPTYARHFCSKSLSASSSDVNVRSSVSLRLAFSGSSWTHLRISVVTDFSNFLLTALEKRIRYCKQTGRHTVVKTLVPAKTLNQDAISRRYLKTPFQDGISRRCFKTSLKTPFQDARSRSYLKTLSQETLSRPSLKTLF